MDTVQRAFLPGCTSMTAAFDNASKTESGCDWIQFRQGSDNLTPQLSGTSFPGMGGTPPLEIKGDTCDVVFHTGSFSLCPAAPPPSLCDLYMSAVTLLRAFVLCRPLCVVRCRAPDGSTVYWGYKITFTGTKPVQPQPKDVPLVDRSRLVLSLESACFMLKSIVLLLSKRVELQTVGAAATVCAMLRCVERVVKVDPASSNSVLSLAASLMPTVSVLALQDEAGPAALAGLLAVLQEAAGTHFFAEVKSKVKSAQLKVSPSCLRVGFPSTAAWCE